MRAMWSNVPTRESDKDMSDLTSKGTEDTGARPAPVFHLRAAYALGGWGIDNLTGTSLVHAITEGTDRSPVGEVLVRRGPGPWQEQAEAAPPAGGPSADADLLRRLEGEEVAYRHRDEALADVLREARARIAQMAQERET